MLASIAFAIFAVAGLAGLGSMAARDHRAALAWRSRLLDDVAALLDGPKLETAADGFPALSGRLADGRRIEIGLLADTLVLRRLPQLWLLVTIRETTRRVGLSIGALARPTGAEFYALVPDLPQRIEPPPGLDPEILLRGGRLPAALDLPRTGAALRRIFSDRRVKEAVLTPRGARIVRQACEGERGAHLLLRQMRFPIAAIAPETVLRAIADADALRDAFDAQGAADAEAA